jgi:hypothetical protein
MGFAHAFMEDVLGRLLMVAVLALLVVGTYELVSLKNEVRELRNTLAAQNTPAVDEDAVADDNENDADDDEADDQDNDQVTVTADDEDALYQRAQDAYVHGQYKDAIDLSESFIDTQPGRAWRIIGASACFLRDKPTALKAFHHLDSTGHQFLGYVCSRSNITLK